MAFEADFSFGVIRTDAAAVEGWGGSGEFEDERAFTIKANVLESDRVFGDDLVIDAETGDVDDLSSVSAFRFEGEGIFDV